MSFSSLKAEHVQNVVLFLLQGQVGMCWLRNIKVRGRSSKPKGKEREPLLKEEKDLGYRSQTALMLDNKETAFHIWACHMRIKRKTGWG